MYEHSNKDLSTWKTLQNKTLFGQEKKPLPFLIGTMNLILHHVMVPSLVRSNTFMEDVHNVTESGKYDIVLTNPPFGAEETKDVQNNYPIQVGATEALALQYIMRKIKNGGRCGVILPEGNILFGGGVMAKIRKELLEKYNVHSVISLPMGVFAQMGAGVKTNLIFFEKTGSTKDIWFGELKGDFTKVNVIKDSDVEDIFEKWRKREVSETSWIKTIDEIKEDNYVLSPRNPASIEASYSAIDEDNLIANIEAEIKEIHSIVKDISKIYKK